MKKVFFSLIIVVLLFVGCRSDVEKGSLTIHVSLESNSKTVMPDKDSIKVTSYKILGVCGDNRFEHGFSGDTYTIDDLSSGTWSVSVEGYNSSKLVARSSSVEVVIKPYQDVNVVFQLKPSFGGAGTFSFKLGIPKDATDMKQIKCSLVGASEGLGTYDFSFDFSSGRIEGDYSIFEYSNDDIPGGSYDLSVVTTNSLDEVFGIPINDSVIVYTDQATNYEHIWDMEYFPEVTLTINDGSTTSVVSGVSLVFTSNNENAKLIYSVDKGTVDRDDSEYEGEFICLGHVIAMAVIDGWSRNGYSEISNRGPSGGWIFYDCDADNDPNENGGRGKDNLMSTGCGWRYLEAAPADLRVVDGKPTVDSTASGYDNAEKRYIFGYYRTSASEKNKAAGTNISIGSGEANTQNLVEKMGDNAYTYSSGSETTADYAARLCSILEYEHDGVFYTDWFLPSKDELNLMYENLKKKGIGLFADNDYWSSSESNADNAWEQSFFSGNQYYGGSQGGGYRVGDSRVRPIRAF